jgi:hypothetical protein
MSQVDKFNQLNNPDYVYFDLQQTNIYNATTQEQQPLKFLETRETPVIKNTGDYYMSVARFQLDTYNLPVIVGEPDLTQTGTFDPDKTIYKVAMNITNGSVTTAVNINASANLASQITYTQGSFDAGEAVATASTGTKDTICVAVSDRAFNSARGRILIWKGTTTSSSIAHELQGTTNANSNLGWNLGISDDGTRVIAGSNVGGIFIYNIVEGVYSTSYIVNFNYYLNNHHEAAISGDGTIYAAGGRQNRNVGIYNYSISPFFPQVGLTFSQPSIGDYLVKGIALNTNGTWFMTSGFTHDSSKGYIEMRNYNAGTNTWTLLNGLGGNNQFTSTLNNDRLGFSFALSGTANYACASALPTTDTGNYVRVYKRTGNAFALTTSITGINSIGWGTSVSMSNNGETIIVSAPSTGTIYIYKRGTGVETYTLFGTVVAPSINTTNFRYFEKIAIKKDGNAFYGANLDKIFPTTAPLKSIYNYTFTDARPAGTVIPLPSNISSTPTIESIKWIKDLEDATAPTQNSLTGKNTALYPYYYCNSYNNFITMVNKTLKLAYKNLMEYIYNNWIVGIGDTGITNQFLSISARQYPTPPFIDWNESNLTADVYVSMLFETYQTAANAVIANINYAMPEIAWGSGGGNSVSGSVANTPFKFELAFNAPLYSLFSSLPATKKVITNSTGKRELYYTLNFYSSGLGLLTPNPALNSIIPYTFLSTYTNSSTGVVTIPTTYTGEYSHQKLLIKQSQEISTIDTWTPVNAIVFTTTSIPIIVNQFTASSSIGSSPPSSSLDNAFAFVITDLQSNQQGYRPNILLTPKIYRMIDLTGNQPLKNIDINVFWRTKTGTLIPFTLASGAMSSIKLLFQKKVLGENQQINLASMSVRNIQ